MIVHCEIGKQLGIDGVVGRVAGDALAEIVDADVRAQWETTEMKFDKTSIVFCLQNGDADQKLVRLLHDGVIDVAFECKKGSKDGTLVPAPRVE